MLGLGLGLGLELGLGVRVCWVRATSLESAFGCSFFFSISSLKIFLSPPKKPSPKIRVRSVRVRFRVRARVRV